MYPRCDGISVTLLVLLYNIPHFPFDMSSCKCLCKASQKSPFNNFRSLPKLPDLPLFHKKNTCGSRMPHTPIALSQQGGKEHEKWAVWDSSIKARNAVCCFDSPLRPLVPGSPAPGITFNLFSIAKSSDR